MFDSSKKFLARLKDFYLKFNEDECTLFAATISYFAFFSIFPAIMLIVGIFGYVVGYEKAVTAVIDYFHRFVPGGITLIDDNLRGIVKNSSTLGVIGFLGLLWAGSGIFGVLEIGLNRIMGIGQDRTFVSQKIMSFVMLFFSGLTVLASIAFRAAASTIDVIPKNFQYYGFLKVYSGGISILSSALFFGLIYYVVPNASMTIKRIWIGMLFATTSFEFAKFGFFWYLASGLANYSKIYGSLGAVIIFLLWINISSLILLAGAEINAPFPSS